MSILNNPPDWTVADASTSQIQIPLISNSATTYTIRYLTSEEIEELKTLDREHETKLKLSKIEKFKSQSSNNRQYLIDKMKAHEAVNNINNDDIAKSSRHFELSALRGGPLHNNSAPYANSTFNYDSLVMPRTMNIRGISLEELEKAHLEQSMEEEVLNGK